MICSDNDVEKLCRYSLICYSHMNPNYTIFVDFFLCVKNIEHQSLISFLLLTSIYYKQFAFSNCWDSCCTCPVSSNYLVSVKLQRV
jgi:hypothetical protein